MLEQAGFLYRIEVSDADEIMDQSVAPDELVQCNAKLKAEAVAKKSGSEIAVLGADTVVAVDGKIFGKPVDEADAVRMLTELSGKAHHVLTGIALIYHSEVYTAVADTKVYFSRLAKNDIERYISSGEPFGKAGAYAVQGRAAAFISRIEGSFSNVVGLPLFLLAETAKKAGVDLYGNDGT